MYFASQNATSMDRVLWIVPVRAPACVVSPYANKLPANCAARSKDLHSNMQKGALFLFSLTYQATDQLMGQLGTLRKIRTFLSSA